MIAFLIIAGITVWAVRSLWFTELAAGAAILVLLAAPFAGRWDVAATASLVLIASIWRMAREV